MNEQAAPAARVPQRAAAQGDRMGHSLLGGRAIGPLAAFTAVVAGLKSPGVPVQAYALAGAAVALALNHAGYVHGAGQACVLSIGIGTGVMVMSLQSEDVGLLMAARALQVAGMAGYTVVAVAQRAEEHHAA